MKMVDHLFDMKIVLNSLSSNNHGAIEELRNEHKDLKAKLY